MIIRDRHINADGQVVSHPDAEIVLSSEPRHIFVEFLALKTWEQQEKEEWGEDRDKGSFLDAHFCH